MATGDRQCIVCGKKYHFCYHDIESKCAPSWKVIYCSEECKNKSKIRKEKNGTT